MTTATLVNKIETSRKEILNNIFNFIKILSELTKIRITFFVSVTTFVGYLLQKGQIDLGFLLPTFGVLVLASGASALNEFQERESDSKMVRTRFRPIPSGRISPSNALFISFALIVLGLIIMAMHSLLVMLLGLFTLIWYNGIYTPIKMRSSLAIIPGSLVGALPPIIGWAAAGGDIFHIQIMAFAAFMFIWQIPHFWLLLLIYDNQYKEADFPTLSSIISFSQISKFTFVWIVLLVLASSLFYFSGLSVSMVANLILILLGILTVIYSMQVMNIMKKEIYRKSFLVINLYVLCVLVLLSIEKIT